jgi:hypothetical protein
MPDRQIPKSSSRIKPHAFSHRYTIFFRFYNKTKTASRAKKKIDYVCIKTVYAGLFSNEVAEICIFCVSTDFLFLDEHHLIVKGYLFCEKHYMRLKVQRSVFRGSGFAVKTSLAGRRLKGSPC